MPSPFIPPTVPGAQGYPLGLTGATAATRYVGATASGAPGSGTFAVGDFIIDQSGKVYVCTVAGSPGTWAQAGGSAGLFDAYAFIVDEKTTNVAGGTFTTGAWRVRDLNTERIDASGIVSIAANRFTLVGARNYYVEISAPAFNVARHGCKLVKDPAGTPVDILVTPEQSYNLTTMGRTVLRGNLTQAGDTVYQVEHQCGQTEATDGFGVESNSGVTNFVSTYTTVAIWRYGA